MKDDMKEAIHLLISAAWSDACRERERLLDDDDDALELIESTERACRLVADATGYEGHLSGDERPAWAERYRQKLSRLMTGEPIVAGPELRAHEPLLLRHEWALFNGGSEGSGAPQKDDALAPAWADDDDAAIAALQAGYTLFRLNQAGVYWVHEDQSL